MNVREYNFLCFIDRVREYEVSVLYCSYPDFTTRAIAIISLLPALSHIITPTRDGFNIKEAQDTEPIQHDPEHKR